MSDVVCFWVRHFEFNKKPLRGSAELWWVILLWKNIKTAIFWVVTHYGKFEWNCVDVVSCCLYVSKKCQNEGIIVLLKM